MPPVKRKPNDTSAVKITSQKSNPLTSHIQILGMGRSKHSHRFVKLLLKGRASPVLIRYDNLHFNRPTTFEWLNQQGAHLIAPAAQTDLIKRIQANGPSRPSFKVAEEIGLLDNCFILPDRTIPALPDKVEICLNDIPADIIAKYKTEGTLEGWQELAGCAVGNTRMMFAFALNFVGPVSAIWPRQFVGFQLTGPRSSGKSVIAVVSTSTWGWDPILGKKYGFGTNWNITVNKLEVICKGFNNTILFLDETGVAERKLKQSVDILEAIMRLDSQTVKGRMTDDGRRSVWYMPVLSTSNLSVARMVKVGAPDADPGVYSDRLMDIPVPGGEFGMFETLHEFRDIGEFSHHLKTLAAANHGLAAREFVNRILEKRAEDPKKLKDFLVDREKGYKRTARKRIGSSKDLVRIHDKFATVYAAGCLAIREKILPFEHREFLEAILKCEEDHVRFVKNELAGVVQPQRTGIEILSAYIQENRHTFIDLENGTPPIHAPMRRMRSACCARAASGHAIGAQPSRAMNSRRFN